jgi:integrase
MTYTPTIDIDTWAATRSLVTAAVAKCKGKTAYVADDLMQATTRLAARVHEQPELELSRRVVFAPATIERFIAEGLLHYAPASRGNRRSMLLRMSEALLGDSALRVRLAPMPASTASAPYTKEEIAELRAWVRLSTGPRRKNAMALVALGFGAGLSASEILGVTRRDIVAEGTKALVTVRGARPRTVLMERAWSDKLLRAVAKLEPGDWVFGNGRTTSGKNLVTNFIAKTATAGLAPNTQRMRATWIVGQLQAGVGAVPLMRSAGVASLEAITRYVQFVDEAA